MNVRLTAGSLPQNYCITSLQEFYNLMFANAYGELDTTASLAKVIVSAAEPTADQRDYVWIRRNPVTLVVDRIYNYINGRWVSPHPVPASGHERRIWVGPESQLDAYDGGDGTGTVGADLASGPMWEVDEAFAGRFPLGVGTLPSGTVISNRTTGGAEEVTIGREHLPNEKIDVDIDIIGHSSVSEVVGTDFGTTPVDGSGRVVDSTSSDFTDRFKPKGQSEELGDGEALNIMPPYYGSYYIRRTARKYYTPS